MKLSNVGLALGGGGVKGLAHIPLLKLLDELNVKPEIIAGTSMGSIVGALYAAGLSGESIEARVRDHILAPGERPRAWIKKHKQLIKWAKVFSFDRNRGGFVTADGLFEHLFSEIVDLDFNDLKIPFISMAADFHSAEAVALTSGNLLEAVCASMAVPGIFAPVEINGRLLIDGGVVNNLPCDKIGENTECRIASDVISLSPFATPKTTQVISGALDVMLTHNTRQMLNDFPPDILFKPDTSGIDPFDFFKLNEALARGEEEADRLREKLS